MPAMSHDFAIDGICAPRFEKVRDAFAANFAAGKEVGASFAATLDGALVVDLWGGHADAARTRPWTRDTIVNVWSTTKAMTALAAHMLVDRGVIDLDAPVAKYWPEFAAGGKASIPVHMLLSHRAGLAGLREKMPVEALWNWDAMPTALAAQEPWWEPGTANGYHAITYGHLVGEVVRRAAGTTIGTFFRDEVAKPLGVDFHIGLPASEDARVADLVPPSAADLAAAAPNPDTLRGKVLTNPPLSAEIAMRTEWRRAEIPAANGHGNARSVARTMGMLACGGVADGRRYLSEAALARATSEQSYGKDLVLPLHMRWGLGFMLSSQHLPLGPSLTSFGHGGWGGSLGIADPDRRLSWAYVMNKMSAGTTGDLRVAGPVAALYGSLAG
jgi:CubicO group peptidase (beta-lactamase class C family)